jgi:succinoglycan biosynthesis transport protein ExoP
LDVHERHDGLPAAPRRPESEALLRALRRRRTSIVLFTLLVTFGALAYSLSQQKIYSASTGLLFRDAQLDQKLFGTTTLPPSTDPAREAATNVTLVGLEAVAQRAATALGGGITARQVAGKVSASATGQSDIVQVTAEDHSPEFAARLANVYAEQFIAFRREADRSKIAGAQQLVTTQLSQLQREGRAGGPSGISLQHYAQQLGIVASLQTGNAELVQPAQIPTSPSSPQPVRNALLGLFLGLVLAIGGALVRDRLDRRIKDIDELEQIYALPILGDVPESQTLGNRAAEVHGFAAAESFRMLRARLRYFNVDREIRSLLITSVGAAEGKTTVAQNLAAAAASAESARVLLLEADLRRPRLAANLGLAVAPGLAEMLSHGIGLSEAVQPVMLSETASGVKTLDVIVAGINPPNPAELLESHKMADLLDRLGAIYDLVIIDTPPAGLIADAIPLMSRVGGVVIVSSVGRSSRDAAAAFREQLAQLRVPVLGVIANRVKLSGGGAYYGDYGGGYYYTRGGSAPDPPIKRGAADAS